MFTTNFSKSLSRESNHIRKFCAALALASTVLPQLGTAQDLSFAALSHNLVGTPALARAEAKPESPLPLLERLETLEELSEPNAPAEIKALFAEGLPCQLHARTSDGAEITEVHPLFPASAETVEPAPAAPAPLPKMTPTPKSVVQPLMSTIAADAPFVTEKIKSLQKMVDLMHAKEELLQRRAAYERKLSEFDTKVGKE